MFASMAEFFGAGAVAVVLTGMGRDGTAGARRIVEAGGWVVAQDAESSVVWGMPGSVAREGLASAILPPDRMGRYFASQMRSEEHTSELQSLMRISYAVFCLKKKKTTKKY